MTARSAESRISQISHSVLTTRPEDLAEAIAQYDDKIAAATTDADIAKYEKAKRVAEEVADFRGRLVALMGDPLVP